MKKNMGQLDRLVRFAIAILVGVLFYTETISGTLGYVLIALSAVFLITSFISFCPLYTLVGLKTCKVK
ncbi:YgaP family membrane protein [Aquimarina spongiae]|uniref:Inner membrane protein YgaP-like transmembrane domain-containing protein n=1 Tax=Aquimarina spongiae TaxID=570521 RepID=A0A1M6B805_9FLAO|nr:DUF2892 domain-containing protein [Aquimarina spongiae]SHI44845.1 Protein of unknown function [Aquimarina spongiae]